MNENCPSLSKRTFPVSATATRRHRKGYVEMLSAFRPKFRNKIMISRTNLLQHGRNLQILMVTAPGEAEEDVAKAKLVGIKMMGKLSSRQVMNFGDSHPVSFQRGQ